MTEKKIYIAHLKQTEQGVNEVQTVKQHCIQTAELAASFAVEPLKDIAYDCGCLHDAGKYQSSFQKRIRGMNIHVDHSTAGAIEAEKDFTSPAALLMAYVIAGHHGGIPDGGQRGDTKDDVTLSGRLKRSEDLDDWSACHEVKEREVDHIQFAKWLAADCRSLQEGIDKFAFIVRYCYSCLVDADSLDTEFFFTGRQRETLKSDYQTCLHRLDQCFSRFHCISDLQKARSHVQKQAYENMRNDGDVYFLNMPTGSGKTLCSAKCALMKAIEEGKKHIIYVIPYNSIISQTADQFTDIFGNSAHILRHQSTYNIDDNDDVSEEYKIRFTQATENWDADLIITTAVQFFETASSNSRSRLRKLHNMADSIMIFDEAHLMPLEYLQPCLETVSYLTRCCNAKAIFMTATMPDYEKLFQQLACRDIRTVDLVPDHKDFHFFRRCEFHESGYVSIDQLRESVMKNRSSLIVVNSRAKARRLYEALGGRNRRNLFHLSTYMTKFDLQKTIEDIKQALLSSRSESISDPVIVVSTSLIEAGVDLDFQAAYREYTGLDSILQTGGRCNREGMSESGRVCIFGFEEDEGKADDIRTAALKQILHSYKDIQSAEAVKEYYHLVYELNSDRLTENAMHTKCRNITDIPFASYDGRIIRNSDVSIVVAENEEAEQLCDLIRQGRFTNAEVRKMQKYSCSVHRNEFEDLQKQGAVNDYKTGIWILENMDYYDDSEGIRTEGVDYFI